jgi:hypothetical protein
MTSSASKSKDVSDVECFYCKNRRHWKRNCPQFLEDKMNGNVPSSSGILVLKLTLLLLFMTECWTPVHVLIFIQMCRH